MWIEAVREMTKTMQCICLQRALRANYKVDMVDSCSIKPLFIPCSLFILNLFFLYENELAVLSWIILIIFLAAYFFAGCLKIFKRHLKQAASYIVPSFVFIALLFTPIRTYELHARHYLQFLVGKQKYLDEIESMSNSVPRYKEWLWSSYGTFLIFDETDKTWLVSPKQKEFQKCETLYKLESHFYVVDFFC